MQGEAARVKALLDAESSRLADADQQIVQLKAEAQVSRLMAGPPSPCLKGLLMSNGCCACALVEALSG